MTQVCLFKDANHLCGEDAVSTVVVGADRESLDEVPACERHRAAVLSSAQAARFMAEAANGKGEPPAAGEPTAAEPATPAA